MYKRQFSYIPILTILRSTSLEEDLLKAAIFTGTIFMYLKLPHYFKMYIERLKESGGKSTGQSKSFLIAHKY